MCSFQELFLGDRCCMDLMGATQFNTSRPNWDKRCCSNPRGSFVQPPADIDDSQVKQLNTQIGRMPALSNVSIFRRSRTIFKKKRSNAIARPTIGRAGHLFH